MCFPRNLFLILLVFGVEGLENKKSALRYVRILAPKQWFVAAQVRLTFAVNLSILSIVDGSTTSSSPLRCKTVPLLLLGDCGHFMDSANRIDVEVEPEEI